MAKQRKKRRKKTCESAVPPELRGNLEVTRLYLLALFRSLDRLQMAQDLPEDLRILFEFDATLAEALWVLDQPLGGYNLVAMTQDSLATIEAILETATRFLNGLSWDDRIKLAKMVSMVRKTLTKKDAYNQIPGRDPMAE